MGFLGSSTQIIDFWISYGVNHVSTFYISWHTERNFIFDSYFGNRPTYCPLAVKIQVLEKNEPYQWKFLMKTLLTWVWLFNRWFGETPQRAVFRFFEPSEACAHHAELRIRFGDLPHIIVLYRIVLNNLRASLFFCSRSFFTTLSRSLFFAFHRQFGQPAFSTFQFSPHSRSLFVEHERSYGRYLPRRVFKTRLRRYGRRRD